MVQCLVTCTVTGICKGSRIVYGGLADGGLGDGELIVREASWLYRDTVEPSLAVRALCEVGLFCSTAGVCSRPRGFLTSPIDDDGAIRLEFMDGVTLPFEDMGVVSEWARISEFEFGVFELTRVGRELYLSRYLIDGGVYPSSACEPREYLYRVERYLGVGGLVTYMAAL